MGAHYLPHGCVSFPNKIRITGAIIIINFDDDRLFHFEEVLDKDLLLPVGIHTVIDGLSPAHILDVAVHGGLH